jgi:molybdopterin molybdotransferase
MVERTEAYGERVRVLESVDSGAHVRPRGENIVKGDVLLSRGQRIGPAEVGLLAGAGRAVVPVARSPRVAIVPTGDELVEPGVQPGPAQIRNSNGYSLHAQVRDENGSPAYLGIARDVDAALDEKIAQGLRYDVLLLCGGVSMGEYDLVTAALQRAGVTLRFEKVAVKPGKPTVFGVHEHAEGSTLVFGLPGNPVSGMVMFRLLVAPALRTMQGACKLVENGFPGRLAAPLRPTMGRTCFHPVRVERDESGLVAVPVAHRGSGDLVAWREANAMIRLPAGRGAEAGELVDIFLHRDHELR